MLIGFMRDSVLQCFCHTCRAPILQAVHRPVPLKQPTILLKPRAKQPKKVKFIATEIRCQEMSKGGVAYEVILAEPAQAAPTTPKVRAASPEKSISKDDIEEKLRAAEERRRSLEASKMAQIAQKMTKIEEASRKKEEATGHFITNTKEALDAKMEQHEEKREAYITELRTKVKDHLQGVEKTRLTLEQQAKEVYKAIEDKMNSAEHKRDENVKKMLKRLKEHEEQVLKVRNTNAERFQQLESSIQEKLQQAEERRRHLEDEQREKLHNYNTVKVAEVRNSLSNKINEITKDLEIKMTTAEQNREKVILKKLEPVKKQGMRAEKARQNKSRSNVEQATSG